jgi:hypothetical protein
MAQKTNNVEYHKCMSVRHELTVGDEILIEVKRWISVTGPKDSDTKSRIIKTHKRQIGDKSITIVEENGQRKRITDLSQKEQDELEDKWEKLWVPKISQEQIKNVVQTEIDEERLKELQFEDLN